MFSSKIKQPTSKKEQGLLNLLITMVFGVWERDKPERRQIVREWGKPDI